VLDQAADRLQEVVQPSPLVDPLLGSGPASELLPIIRQHGEPVPRATKLPQICSRFLGRAKRDQVAESLVDGKQRHPFAVALGPVRGVQLVAGEAGDQKVPVIYQCISNAGGCQVCGQLRLPHPLGKPQPLGVHSKPGANGIVHPLDLLDSVCPRQGDQHRLVEPGQEQLDLAVAHQAAELIEISRVMLFEPLEQRSREMEHGRQKATAGQMLENGTIHVLEVLLEDVVKVADRLVEVEAKHEPDRNHGLAYHE
jgi:hypothetical protein